jgi:hypothetical protein
VNDASSSRTPALWLAAAGLLLAGALAALVWGLNGRLGLLYAGLYVVATLPGWPIGFALFGRRHAAGWIGGIVVGYGLTSLLLWMAVRYGFHSIRACGLAWVAVTVVTWLAAGWRRTPLVELPAWRRSDSLALLLVLVIVPALCSSPFLHVGRPEPDGGRAYRAYFTMDFFWHTALTAEVSKFSSPPRNPYWAAQPLNYYWGYFLLPSFVIGNAPAKIGLEIMPTLLINALMTGTLMISAVFLLAWAAFPRPAPVAVSVALVVVASSAEGLFTIVDLLHRGRPLSMMRELNIDAISAWHYNSLRIDGLQRSLWWVPQHAMACALGLVALLVMAPRTRRPAGAILLAGTALGLSLCTSPFIGGAFSLVFGLAFALESIRSPRELLRGGLRHALAALPVVVALAWCVSTGVLAGTSGAVKVGWGGLVPHFPVRALILSLGPVLLPAALGLWPGLRRATPLTTSLAGLLVGLGVYYFAWMPLDEAYIGFRAGQIMMMTLPALMAAALAWLYDQGGMRRAAPAVVAIAIAGVPTLAVDWYNAQDTTFRDEGPGFKWTQVITPDEQAAFQWIRRSTPADATVQMEPTVRDRDTWTMIPTFAERRMAAGLAFPLLQEKVFEERSNRARRMYETFDATEAWRIARELGVDYVYFDRTEQKAFPPEAVGKFAAHPEYFGPAFANDEVRIFRVIQPGA